MTERIGGGRVNCRIPDVFPGQQERASRAVVRSCQTRRLGHGDCISTGYLLKNDSFLNLRAANFKRSVFDREDNRNNDARSHPPGIGDGSAKVCSFHVLGYGPVKVTMRRADNTNGSSFGTTQRVYEGAHHNTALNIRTSQIVRVRHCRTRNDFGTMCGSGVRIQRSDRRSKIIEPGRQSLATQHRSLLPLPERSEPGVESRKNCSRCQQWIVVESGLEVITG